MKDLEKILREIRHVEQIDIDQAFKNRLKRKIVSRSLEKNSLNISLGWKRFIIITAPLAVTVVMFFYYYQEHLSQPSFVPVERPSYLQNVSKEQPSASIYTNLDTEDNAPPLGLSSGKEEFKNSSRGATPQEMAPSESYKPPSSPPSSIQQTDLSFLLLGGVILMALISSLLFWYLTEKSKKKH